MKRVKITWKPTDDWKGILVAPQCLEEWLALPTGLRAKMVPLWLEEIRALKEATERVRGVRFNCGEVVTTVKLPEPPAHNTSEWLDSKDPVAALWGGDDA